MKAIIPKATTGSGLTRRGLSRRSLLAGAAAFLCVPGTVMAARAAVMSLSEFAKSSKLDEMQLLSEAATEAVAKRVPLFIDRPISFDQRWVPPKGLDLRGDGTDRSRIVWVGVGDAIEVTGALSIDGVTLDGGPVVPEDRSTGRYDCLLGIHGSLREGPAYLSGVRIGKLRIRRTKSVGLVSANVAGLKIDELILEDVFCNGMIMSGLKDAQIGKITARNIGDLRENGHRRGSAVCIFAETKPVTKWYDPEKLLATENLRIGSVDIAKTTDSAFYIHDEYNVGVRDVRIGSIAIDTAGKDGFKTRVGPVGVTIDKVSTTRTSLRGVDVESDDTTIRECVVSEVGFDSVGAILGRPAPFTGGNAIAESIQTNPCGIVVMDCANVRLDRVSVSKIHSNPVTSGEGHGIRLYKTRDVKIAASVDDCGGNGLRISGSTDFDIDIKLSDACRNGTAKQAILISSDKAGMSANGKIRGTVRQAIGGGAMDAVVVNDSCNVDVAVFVVPAEFPERPAVRTKLKKLKKVCGESGQSAPTVREILLDQVAK